MKYNLTKPCANCPFRNDIRPFLRKDSAAEIVNSLVLAEFPCHKTLDYHSYDEGGGIETEKTQHCAGALIMLEHMEKPSQMMRICERLGMYDRFRLDMDAPVFSDARDFIDTQEQS